MANSKIRVAVIYGGASGEHSISIATAGAVMRALDPQRYEAVPIAITKEGTWVPGASDPSELSFDQGLLEVETSSQTITIPAGDGSQALVSYDRQSADSLSLLGKVDVVFPLLHGPFGEDGTIQGLLEMAGVPYVGCGVFASAAGMDKHYMKVVLQSAGLPVAPYVVATARRWRDERESVLAEVAQLQFPVYVKPARAGSSLGISRVTKLEDVPRAVAQAQVHDPKVIIEQGVNGREIECAVLGGHNDSAPRASVVGEVLVDLPDDGFYDFEHKYLDTEGLQMSIPARVPEEISEKIRAQAVQTFDAFGCEGMARVDFFLTPEGQTFVIELNTIPGFTPFSMYPVLWENTGLSYSELLDELIELARERPTGLR
ncbi:D-alanine--D-alanine ligase family protein [Arcanobacterium pinnipediorum]|uniref:D-alanine--D-alanine ligase n=1 Tax=Arcanobacterium pinnipediorum TaxID=1503041 RepID=A0ABY5AFK3_9ACTO|nr:D-alanine--D-alanine ligase family protein [Arcanobacterium pinnipediorum]USR78847.1 D-alanine--D-alanine ligase [Arcanobacterium pinnipediorum]